MIQTLEQRANRYTEDWSYEEIQDQNILDAKIDETRTIHGTGIQLEKQDNGNETKRSDIILNDQMANNINKAQWKQTELEEVMWVDEYLLKVQGIALGKKEDGIVRLMYENLNGLNSTLSGNNKLENQDR